MNELPQRRLALELRYAIDIARRVNSEASYARVKELIAGNPHNVRSRHVEHNLGVGRIDWLKKRPSLGWRKRGTTRPNTVESRRPVRHPQEEPHGTKRRAAEEGTATR
jgi:hypothetical protein